MIEHHLPLLRAHLRPPFAEWATKFPPALYAQLFRLNGWAPDARRLRRPSLLARYLADAVFHRLPADVLGAWAQRAAGLPAAVQRHLAVVEGLMLAAPNWKQFQRLANRALPVLNDVETKKPAE